MRFLWRFSECGKTGCNETREQSVHHSWILKRNIGYQMNTYYTQFSVLIISLNKVLLNRQSGLHSGPKMVTIVLISFLTKCYSKVLHFDSRCAFWISSIRVSTIFLWNTMEHLQPVVDIEHLSAPVNDMKNDLSLSIMVLERIFLVNILIICD